MGVTLTTLTKQGCFDSDIEGQINTNFTNLNAAVGSGTTGTGLTVLQTSPTLITPTLGVATATSVNKVTVTAPATGSTLTIADGKTLTVNNTLTLAGTDATTLTFPTTSATVARTDAGQTFTGANTLAGTLLTGLTAATGINYIASETGANNAIVGTFTGAPTIVAGLRVSVLLSHSLQAGANTFNYAAGGALNIKSHRNTGNNIATAYVSGGIVDLMYDGTQWQDMSQ